LNGCATWSTSSVETGEASKAPQTKEVRYRPPANEIIISENDISERPYQSLGEIEVTVNKTTIFNADPTRAQVDLKLRERASELGADAVVLVRYGTVGISAFSWGSLNGKGRAVRFVD
jgi:hypothetical protein